MTTTDIFTPNPSEKDIDTSLNEITEHGNSLFPFAVHFTDHNAQRKFMIHTHWHREMEILYISHGQMDVQIEGKHFIAKKGDILFIPPNLLHGAMNYQQSPCAFFAIVFDSFFMESHSTDLIQQSYIDPIIKHPSQHIVHATHTIPNIQSLRSYITELVDVFALKQDFFELALKANMLLFLKALYTEKDLLFNFDHVSETKNEITSFKCKKIVLFIEENYNTHITLEDISSHIGFSQEHFCRFFKKHFRMSFFTYLNKMRIMKAEYLLLNTSLRIIDIAFESGFEDPNYFATVFKKEIGLTPSAYRKKPNDTTLL